MPRVSFTVPDDLAAEVDEAVERGDYLSRDAVVVDALRAWSYRHLYEPAVVEKLRALVAEADASGPGEPWDRAQFLERMNERNKARSG